ncbi:hypothetical protein OBBRIDRAFT_887644 [Obba rivulosa]|uniref:THO complex subunit 1 n=1 Tax=Obba rivulosa TaxID=1052685 RepID=A0A8E2AT73_9APHY|nr:hypothetical protein OBBRIDRAFT_887644 [Obba rivulosa]
MQALETSLKTLLSSLPPRPVDKQTLDDLVSKTLEETSDKVSLENRKTQWEYLLRKEVFNLAATEGKALKDPNTSYYEDLRGTLDLVLTFTEHDACEHSFPLQILADIVEAQTIASCSHIFSWIEARAARLTKDMVPQKGKALILLRTLNDLLRRLSKTGSTTMFCGRILAFLSRVFPLAERSGVNLRGEYGPMWDGPGVIRTEREEKEATKEEEEKMHVDEAKPEVEEDPVAKAAEERRKRQEEFYNTFWSLQLPFSRPTLFADPAVFPQFKESVNKVLPVIKEATTKERALMGSKTHAGGGASLKRKREPEAAEDNAGKEYFFAKYLTSPELLDLEIADTHFRRQFLFQLLILLNHLLTFTKAAKATWLTPRNRSLQIDFTLEASDEQWVVETAAKALEELRQTAPNGRAFADTAAVILEREKNWIRWKNELCPPFDREPWSEEVEVDGVKRKVGLEEATREVRKRMRMDPPEWPHRLGSAPLTEIWEMGYRDLRDLEHPFQPGDVSDFVKKIKQEDARIEMRKKQLAKTAERLAQARARAAAQQQAAESPAPPASAASTPARAAPTPAAATPPLHPSLPAKPGTLPLPPAPLESAAASPVRVPTPDPPPATPTPTPAPEPVVVVLPPDEQIAKYEENKTRWTWLALRTARDQYLQHFGKIGTGDVLALAQEIEKEKQERERAAAEPPAPAPAADESAAASSPAVVGPVTPGESLKRLGESENSDAAGEVSAEPAPAVNGVAEAKDVEGDVNMEK